jgi:MerR family copper efflux transcriptional regulator
MRINQFAQLTNLSAKTIRYYEDIGLLPPAHRLDNGYRDYDDTDVDKARFVAGARSLDFSLDDIQEILALREQREAPCRVVLDLLQEKAGEIRRRVTELRRMEAELRELHRLGLTFPTNDVDGKNCVCHLVSEHSESTAG